MEEAPPLWIPWLLALAGAAPGVWYLTRTFGAALHVPAFVDVLRKLFAAGNIDRALKLTHAAGRIPIGVATRAAIHACGRGVTHDASADYRSAGDLSPERVLAPVRRDYDAAFLEAAAPLRRARFVALLGVPLLVAALVLGVATPGPPIAAGLGLAAIAWAALKERGIRASRDECFAALADHFDALIRDPRRVPQVASSTRVRVGFEVSEPGRAPRVVDTGEEVIKIGSLETAHVCLDAPGVARMHAVVEHTDEGYAVIDLGADAKTRVNGEPVNRQMIVDGDVLTIGEAELRLRVYR